MLTHFKGKTFGHKKKRKKDLNEETIKENEKLQKI